MNTTLRAFLAVLLTTATAWLVGCGKSSEPAPRTRTELLTGAKWRMTGLVIVTTLNGTSTTVDEMLTKPACEKDDFITFFISPPSPNSNNTFTYDEGPISCHPGQNWPQTFDGGWKFGMNEASLIFYPQASGTYESPIESLTDKKLVLLDEGHVQVGNASAVYKRTITYTAL